MSVYASQIHHLLAGAALDAPTTEALMGEVLDGALEATQVAAVLTALAAKGVTAPELAGCAAAMRARLRPVRASGPVLDTCGTGGSRLPTMNTSTLAAFVVASDGVRVAKHGNRKSSGKCGSLDVLEHLGVQVALEPEQAERLLEQGPFVFLDARRHHPALGPLGPVRRALGFPTVFNLLGPICNPAGATRQVLGVSDRERAPLMAQALLELGTERALVVSGADRLDEISLCGPTTVHELDGSGEIRARTIDARTFGLAQHSFEAIAGGELEENARRFMEVLSGRDRGPRHLHTAVNAGAALFVAGRADDLRAGFERASALLERGAPAETFARYREASHAV